MTLSVLDELAQALSQYPGVRKVILFGSRATHQAVPFSDIDLAVVGVQDEREWIRLLQTVDAANTLLKIDILQFEKADPAIQASILREGQILYERPARQAGGF